MNDTALHRFPNVVGKNLAGKVFRLPADFEAPLNLVFIAFQRRQQDDVDSWKPLVENVARRFPQVRVYEIPTLSRSYTLFRGFIDGGMRAGIPDPSTRAATITLYIDKGPYDESLGITSEDEITVMLVRPSGEIIWRATGRYDPARTPSLDRYVTP